MSGYFSNSIGNYISDLSARKSTPGGGSAAALNAAIGASLNLMVINYTVKDEMSPADRERCTDIIERQERSLNELVKLIDRDCEVFTSLMKSLSEGKTSDKDYVSAADVPMVICRECLTSMEISLELSENANKNLFTDIGCAAHSLRGAFFSARLNVEINLKCIKDHAFSGERRRELEDIGKKLENLCSETMKNVDNVLKNGE